MVRELSDRWILGLRPLLVTSAELSDGLTVSLEDGTTINVGDTATFGPGSARDRKSDHKPIDRLSSDDIEFLSSTTIASAVLFKSGSLRVVFSTGHQLYASEQDHPLRIKIRIPGTFNADINGSIHNIRVDNSGS
ncbi:MAG: hypothetical protein J2P25_17285 [Nocardiopsaceae bacterium]|nr:hypothetical protein [Nocardiopsaceae bacterium]